MLLSAAPTSSGSSPSSTERTATLYVISQGVSSIAPSCISPSHTRSRPEQASYLYFMYFEVSMTGVSAITDTIVYVCPYSCPCPCPLTHGLCSLMLHRTTKGLSPHQQQSSTASQVDSICSFCLPGRAPSSSSSWLLFSPPCLSSLSCSEEQRKLRARAFQARGDCSTIKCERQSQSRCYVCLLLKSIDLRTTSLVLSIFVCCCT